MEKGVEVSLEIEATGREFQEAVENGMASGEVANVVELMASLNE
jgi:hypothetical protein